MPVTKIKLENFTAFKDLEVEFSPGINALVGANGTGKTHLMKACYAACLSFGMNHAFLERIIGVFLPSGRLGKGLLHQGTEGGGALIEVESGPSQVSMTLTAQGLGSSTSVIGEWPFGVEAAYIPVKEMLANSPGFLSLHAAREIHFEDVYREILFKAYLPAFREPVGETHRNMLANLEQVIGGKVTVRGEEFFLSNEETDIEFTLVAEGWRKLGLLWLLIGNGILREGSVLFWDEPEANLNPKMFRVVIEVLLELQRAGVQVFFATHDYVILKELDLQMTEDDAVAFHSLYRDETGEIACHTTGQYLDIHPNAIGEAFDDIYDRQIERSMRRLS